MRVPKFPAVLMACLIMAAGRLIESSYAQSAPDKLAPGDSTFAPERTKNEEKPLALDPVEVLGSRIHATEGVGGAFPVLTLDRIELERRGVTRLADIRWA